MRLQQLLDARVCVCMCVRVQIERKYDLGAATRPTAPDVVATACDDRDDKRIEKRKNFAIV